MSSENGQNIKLTVFGESHASAVGVVIEGLPAGEAIDEEQIMQFMRRRMGQGMEHSAKRGGQA